MTSVANVTIQSSQVTADLTDFPLLVDLSDMPAGFWSTVASSGGDIRVFKSDGTTELPREVVSIDTVANTGELWVKYAGTLSGSIDTTIQIHADGVSSDYAVTATYGRNNVWSNYVAVYHGDSTDDATGKGGTLSATGTASSVGSVTAKIGTAFDISGPSGFGTTTAGGALVAGGASTVQTWLRKTASAIGGNDFSERLVQYYNSAESDSHQTHVDREAKFFTATLGGNTQTEAAGGVAIVLNEWASLHSVFDQAAGIVTHYRNGVQDTQITGYTDTSEANSTIFIGAQPGAENGIKGQFDEARVSDTGLSSTWVRTEYNNQSSPNTFYLASTPQLVSTPVNLSTTNLQATSARLTWEQG